MQKIVTDNISKKAAEYLADAINTIHQEKDRIILAIPGGRSVVAIFKELKKKNLPWKSIHFFMVDERQVPLTDEESNFKLAQENLFNPLIQERKIDNSQLHPYMQNQEEYKEELEKVGGKFDIVLLSLGEDSHIAALFPNHESIKNESENFITFNNSPKIPLKRMSASRKLIKKSKIAILIVKGEAKRKALERLQNPKETIQSCPAKILESIKESYIITDQKINSHQ